MASALNSVGSAGAVVIAPAPHPLAGKMPQRLFDIVESVQNRDGYQNTSATLEDAAPGNPPSPGVLVRELAYPEAVQVPTLRLGTDPAGHPFVVAYLPNEKPVFLYRQPLNRPTEEEAWVVGYGCYRDTLNELTETLYPFLQSIADQYHNIEVPPVLKTQDRMRDFRALYPTRICEELLPALMHSSISKLDAPANTLSNACAPRVRIAGVMIAGIDSNNAPYLRAQLPGLGRILCYAVPYKDSRKIENWTALIGEKDVSISLETHADYILGLFKLFSKGPIIGLLPA
ncbi:MAG: hypothetical protein HY069_04930 [Chlamydiia bacterium]|nr:hypothetical protein [Chlamydiia bacterium]